MGDRLVRGLVVVAHPDADLDSGGRATIEAVAGLISHGWQVLLTAPSDGPLLASGRRLGAETSIVGAVGMLLPLVRVRPDVVHVRSASMPAWVIAARLLRLPVVALVEGPVRASGGLAIWSIATRVLVHSEHDRIAVINAAGRCEGRTTAVAAPVTPPIELVPARERLEDSIRLLHLDTAGADVAVDVLALLVRGGVDAVLRLAGHEPVDDAVPGRVSALGLGALVTVEAARPDPCTAMAGADVVLVTSQDPRPASQTALHAVLAGRPVVVGDVGARAESVDGYASAISVPRGDPTQLASAVRRTATNWSAFRRTALAMAPIAADRHSAGRYGAAIDLVMRRAARPRAAARPANSSGLAAAAVVVRGAPPAGRLDLDGRSDHG